MKIIILGAKQHAKVIVSILYEAKNKIDILGFLDDDPSLEGQKLLDIPILGPCSLISSLANDQMIQGAIVGISNRFMHIRSLWFQKILSLNLEPISAIHPKAYISPLASIGKGCVINPGVVINAFAKVGNNCVIYSNSSIEHENQLSDNVYVGPGVHFASHVRVCQNTFVGAGTNAIPDIHIGENVTIGAGSVLIKDIPDGYTAAGVPAKLLHNRKPKI